MQLGGRRFLLSMSIIAASVCLALGISLPIIRLTKYFIFTTDHSLLSTVWVLIQDGQTFLGSTILIFSIILPVTKLLYLLLVSTLPATELMRQHSRLRALEWLGKWSMHDVLVLSLTIFFIKSQGVYDAASLTGVYFFTASVVLMILSYSWLRLEGLAALPKPTPPIVLPQPVAPKATAGPPRVFGLRNFVLSFFIILATVFFALGVILPVIRFTTVYVWSREHSIATIIYALFENEEYFLTVVLFLFSIFFPFLKLFYLLTLLTSPDIPPEFRKKSMSTMEWLGRYSMTDVMVLALLIFYVNSSGYTEADVLPGVYFFTASAIMTMLAYGWANTVPAGERAPEPVPLPLPVGRGGSGPQPQPMPMPANIPKASWRR